MRKQSGMLIYVMAKTLKEKMPCMWQLYAGKRE